MACAISMRSNGSWCGPGNEQAAWPWRRVMARPVNPWLVTTPSKSATSAAADRLSLPSSHQSRQIPRRAPPPPPRAPEAATAWSLRRGWSRFPARGIVFSARHLHALPVAMARKEAGHRKRYRAKERSHPSICPLIAAHAARPRLPAPSNRSHPPVPRPTAPGPCRRPRPADGR